MRVRSRDYGETHPYCTPHCEKRHSARPNKSFRSIFREAKPPALSPDPKGGLPLATFRKARRWGDSPLPDRARRNRRDAGGEPDKSGTPGTSIARPALVELVETWLEIRGALE